MQGGTPIDRPEFFLSFPINESDNSEGNKNPQQPGAVEDRKQLNKAQLVSDFTKPFH
jgi:hypothetical protein